MAETDSQTITFIVISGEKYTTLLSRLQEFPNSPLLALTKKHWNPQEKNEIKLANTYSAHFYKIMFLLINREIDLHSLFTIPDLAELEAMLDYMGIESVVSYIRSFKKDPSILKTLLQQPSVSGMRLSHFNLTKKEIRSNYPLQFHHSNISDTLFECTAKTEQPFSFTECFCYYSFPTKNLNCMKFDECFFNSFTFTCKSNYTKFSNCMFHNVTFCGHYSGVDFSECAFVKCTFKKTSFTYCKFKKCKFETCEFDNVDFQITTERNSDIIVSSHSLFTENKFIKTKFELTEIVFLNWDSNIFEECEFKYLVLPKNIDAGKQTLVNVTLEKDWELGFCVIPIRTDNGNIWNLKLK